LLGPLSRELEEVSELHGELAERMEELKESAGAAPKSLEQLMAEAFPEGRAALPTVTQGFGDAAASSSSSSSSSSAAAPGEPVTVLKPKRKSEGAAEGGEAKRARLQ
jgi:hypothetical protein